MQQLSVFSNPLFNYCYVQKRRITLEQLMEEDWKKWAHPYLGWPRLSVLQEK